MKGYLRIPVDMPESPEVLRVVRVATRTVYINRCANKGAKLIILIA